MTTTDDVAAGSTRPMSEYAVLKRELLGGLAGTVLEIGAGHGANFSDLPTDVSWVGLEPSRRRRRVLAATAARHGQHRAPIAAAAERIPLADCSVDAVISTAVLCSVSDQGTALAEIRRVLRPSGAFVFFEHVGAPAGTWTRRLQRGAAPISRRFDSGCDPGRDTLSAIEAAAFREIDVRWFSGFAVIYRPFIGGIAHT